MRDTLRVIPLEEAEQLVLDSAAAFAETEVISLVDSLGRVAAADITADINVPEFRRSTVDGYAVRSRDLKGAGESMPAFMDLLGQVEMGQAAAYALTSSGDTVYVPTGGMLPAGADSVVMLEYSEHLDDRTILLKRESAPGENVVDIGEDMEQGEVVIARGSVLRAYETGVLASLGKTSVQVCKKPRVGIISTGDEVVGEHEVPGPGKIRDINSQLLFALLMEDGCIPVKYGHIPDDFNLLKTVTETAHRECDLVLISGGSSVGAKDHTREAIASLKDSAILIHGIAVKPGKPTIFAMASGKAVFGLPGHPLACAVIYGSLVRPYVEKALGCQGGDYYLTGTFTENHHKAAGRVEFLPVRVTEAKDRLLADPIHAKSGMISGFAKAFGFVRIPRNEEGLKAGQEVKIYRF